MAISVAGLILLLCTLSYLTAPDSDGFTFNSINPLELLEGVVFALGFGLGFPVWLSVAIIGVFLYFIFRMFLWIVKKIVK